MKEVGGSAILYSAFLKEAAVIQIVNAIEGVQIDLKKDFRIKVDPWNLPVTVRHESTAKVVRCLSNVLKHNQGYIDVSNSDQSEHLVQNCGFPDKEHIRYVPSGTGNLIDIEKFIVQSYLYCLDLAAQLAKLPPASVLALADEEQFNYVRRHLVPAVLGL